MSNYIKKDIFGDTQQLLGFEKHAAILKVFTREEEGSWHRTNFTEFSSITIGDILNGTFRFLLEAKINGDHFLFISHDVDKTKLKEKHPKANIIAVNDMLHLFTKALSVESLQGILEAMSVFSVEKIVA